ncbi:MAG: hypothetical protein GX921_05530 [Bacteroidales bacterium]|nr:hypothetical protein [Bacteroidales bacterium]
MAKTSFKEYSQDHCILFKMSVDGAKLESKANHLSFFDVNQLEDIKRS